MVKIFPYVARYPIGWTDQSTLHFTPCQTRLFHNYCTKTIHKHFSTTVYISRHSFIQLSEPPWDIMERTKMTKQREFKPELPEMRVRHSIAELGSRFHKSSLNSKPPPGLSAAYITPISSRPTANPGVYSYLAHTESRS